MGRVMPRLAGVLRDCNELDDYLPPALLLQLLFRLHTESALPAAICLQSTPFFVFHDFLFPLSFCPVMYSSDWAEYLQYMNTIECFCILERSSPMRTRQSATHCRTRSSLIVNEMRTRHCPTYVHKNFSWHN